MSVEGPWLIEVCPYCGEIIDSPNSLFRGHTHHGEQKVHGHSEPVYVSPQIVEVVRRDRPREPKVPPFRPSPIWDLDNHSWTGWRKKALKRLATEMQEEIWRLKREVQRLEGEC